MSDKDRDRKFVELLQVGQFTRTEELVRRLDEGGYWDEELLAGAVDAFKRSYIRRKVRQIKDESGWPIIASIEVMEPSGEMVRVYMPEALFDLEKYQQAAGYWTQRAHYAIGMANGYTSRGNDRFGAQLLLPFPESD